MIDTRAFREAIKTVTVSYPIPFIVAAFLAFTLACFMGSLFAPGVLRWVLAGSGIASMLMVFAVVGYGVLCRPELLRSERFSLLNRYFEVIGDSAMTPGVREQMNVLLATLGDESRKEQSRETRDTHPVDEEGKNV